MLWILSKMSPTLTKSKVLNLRTVTRLNWWRKNSIKYARIVQKMVHLSSCRPRNRSWAASNQRSTPRWSSKQKISLSMNAKPFIQRSWGQASSTTILRDHGHCLSDYSQTSVIHWPMVRAHQARVYGYLLTSQSKKLCRIAPTHTKKKVTRSYRLPIWKHRSPSDFKLTSII